MQYKQIIVSGLTGQQERWIGVMQWFNDHVFAWQDIKRADNGDGESSGVDEALKPRDDVGWDDWYQLYSEWCWPWKRWFICSGELYLYHLNTGLTIIPRYYRTSRLDRNKVLHSPMVAGSRSQYCDDLWTKRNLLPVAAKHPLPNLFQSCNLQLSIVMDTGVLRGILLGPAPAPAENPSRNDGCGIPSHTGTGSNGTHGKEIPCGIGPRVGTKRSIAK